MTTEFKLPLIAEGVEAADIAAVHVHEGDVIQPGQVVLEVETEKAVADIPSPQGGRIEKILVKPGQTVKIGEVLLTIDESAAPSKSSDSGSSQPAAKKEQAAEAPTEGKAAETQQPATATSAAPQNRATAETSSAKSGDSAPAESPTEPQVAATGAGMSAAVHKQDPAAVRSSKQGTIITARSSSDDNGRDEAPVPAGPATRRLARELGVDLHRVPGTGPGGRITTEDVQSFVRTLTTGRVLDRGGLMVPVSLPPFERFGPIERRPMSKLARASASNVSLAWQTVPHVTQHELADVTELEEARQGYMHSIGRNGPKVTMTAILVKAVIGALKAFPHFNASIDIAAGEVVLKHYFHIGVAVDTEFGLLVPVIRDADRKTVLMIAAELADLADHARRRKLGLEQMQGGTFTITNLGGIGGTAFTPIVNYPEVAILGLSRTQTQLKLVDGKLVERLILPLSLSYDHRVINGADAARFVVKLSAILSDFFQLLIEC